MERTRLQQAAFEALADLSGMYLEGGLSDAAKRTLLHLYEALDAEGLTVSDYAEEYEAAKEDVGE